ncbi:MAG TPA: GNAT family N-acetyltransferase [Jiangellaceae bacterium]|nr:GNAT family N-acetyltransferase [Jiangellaceae bacterium]
MVTVREATDADAKAIHESCATALTLDAAEGPALVDLLWTADVDRQRTVLVAGDGAAVACASTGREILQDDSVAVGDAVAGRNASPALMGHIDLIAVHPRAQGRGLGRALVRAAERWLAFRGVSEVRFAGNPPCYGWPGIDVRYTPALCLAERLGYERYQIAWNMTVDLSTDLSTEIDVERLGRAGVDVRAAPRGQRGQVVEFARTHWNDSWAWEVEHASGCHYAIRSGEVLGFAAWGARPAWFGPMGSAPPARGLGIGRVLLRRCLAEQRAAGLDRAEIGWVGPLQFYSRAVGARAERVFALYRRRLEVSAYV